MFLNVLQTIDGFLSPSPSVEEEEVYIEKTALIVPIDEDTGSKLSLPVLDELRLLQLFGDYQLIPVHIHNLSTEIRGEKGESSLDNSSHKLTNEALVIPNQMKGIEGLSVLPILHGKNHRMSRIVVFGSSDHPIDAAVVDLEEVKERARQRLNLHEYTVRKCYQDHLLLNFTCAFLPDDLESIGQKIGSSVDIRTTEYPLQQYDQVNNLQEQVLAQIDGMNISPEDWKEKEIHIILPDDKDAAIMFLAAIYGKSGKYPHTFHFEEIQRDQTVRYEMKEQIYLQTIYIKNFCISTKNFSPVFIS